MRSFIRSLVRSCTDIEHTDAEPGLDERLHGGLD
jgi:hypothetical protein